ncbi:MAG: galactokinase family protein [Gemmatimonadaceae bacterium]|nr:galactokinase family protein [Gemmatimonadaceae bacterium]
MSITRVTELFTMAYGYRPRVVASAPGRVNLIGEHVDYNGGAVLPIAIGQRTWVAVGGGGVIRGSRGALVDRRGRDDDLNRSEPSDRTLQGETPDRQARGGPFDRRKRDERDEIAERAARVGKRSRAVSRERGEFGQWYAGDVKATGVWWDYVAGALEEAHALGAARAGRDVAVVSDVPMGAGLSSSAALEVATILGALAFDGVARPARDVALAAHRAECDFVGVSCGIMDQFASALCENGFALHLQCDTRETARVPFDRSVLIVDTTAPRDLRTSEYNTRRAECDAALAQLRTLVPDLPSLATATPALLERARLAPPLDRRARHVVSEVVRVQDFVQALAAGQPIGLLLNDSHLSLRDDYECSTPELDWVVDRSVARVGVDGARLTGAGWGGCAIVVGEDGALDALGAELLEGFSTAWGRTPRTWRTRPCEGARMEYVG